MSTFKEQAKEIPTVSESDVLSALADGGRNLVQIYNALGCTKLEPLGMAVWTLLKSGQIGAMYHVHSPHEGCALLAVVTDLDSMSWRMTDTSCVPPVDFDVAPDDIEVVFSLSPPSR